MIQKKKFSQSKNQKEKKLLIFPFSLFLCVCIVVGFSFKKVLNKNICVLTSEDKDLRMHAKKKYPVYDKRAMDGIVRNYA